MQEPSPAPLVQAFLSSAVNLNIKLLVQNLHGSMPEMESRGLGYTECLSERTGCTAADLYLEFQLFVHGQPLGLPERTCNMPGSRLRWNEWITFRAKYCDLSADAWIDRTRSSTTRPCHARHAWDVARWSMCLSTRTTVALASARRATWATHWFQPAAANALSTCFNTLVIFRSTSALRRNT